MNVLAGEEDLEGTGGSSEGAAVQRLQEQLQASAIP